MPPATAKYARHPALAIWNPRTSPGRTRTAVHAGAS